MKYATRKVIDVLPILEKHLNPKDSPTVPMGELPTLNNVESTFLKLIMFFEDVERQDFNLKQLYENLDDGWLEIALEVIFTYFKQDTYLLKESTASIIRDDGSYLNQSRFAEYLSNNGLNFDRVKLNVYISRGIIPDASLIISGNKYWKKAVCEDYLQKELTKQKKG